MLDQARLDRILARQESVVSRSQAVACGMTRKALRHRIRPGGPWQELLPLTYLAATGGATHAQQEVAAVLYAGRDTALHAGRDSVLMALPSFVIGNSRGTLAVLVL
jgi:hypothetical protein